MADDNTSSSLLQHLTEEFGDLSTLTEVDDELAAFAALELEPTPPPSPFREQYVSPRQGRHPPEPRNPSPPNPRILAEELLRYHLRTMSEQGDPPPNPPGPDPGVLDNMFQQFFMNMLQRAQQQPAQPGGGAAAPAAQQPRVPLPYPDEKNAPRFDGDEYKVGTFLDSFESRARLAGVAEGQWKKKIVDYCDRDTRNQWMQLDEFTDDSPWDEFRTAVLELYCCGDAGSAVCLTKHRGRPSEEGCGDTSVGINQRESSVHGTHERAVIYLRDGSPVRVPSWS